MSPLRWTCKSAAKLAAELQARGHAVSERTVNRLLHGLGLQPPVQPQDRWRASDHPDRDAQFRAHQPAGPRRSRGGASRWSRWIPRRRNWSATSRTAGREWQPEGEPEEVKVHDFLDKELGKAIPYGVYDLTANTGLGQRRGRSRHRRIRRRDAAAVVANGWAAGSTRRRSELLITADGGGCNGSRCRLWKVELQELADETGLRITVCHFPPGTSKWNKIEHRMFCHITENWRGRPLVSREVRRQPDRAARRRRRAWRSERSWMREATRLGREVTDEQMEGLSIKRDEVPRRVELHHPSKKGRETIGYSCETPKAATRDRGVVGRPDALISEVTGPISTAPGEVRRAN